MMGKLLKFELRKVFRSKSLYICTAITVFLVLIVALTTKIAESEVDIVPTASSLTKSSFSEMNAILLSSIFVSIYICEDYSLGTIKNIYGKGYTRNQVYFTKYIVSLIASLIMTLSCFIVGYLCGLIFSHKGTLEKDVIISVLLQLLVSIGFLSCHYFVSMSIGRLGICLAINIVAPTFVKAVLALIDIATKWEKFHFSDYWLGNMLNAVQASEIPAKTQWTALIGALVYIAIFLVSGFFINRRREIK